MLAPKTKTLIITHDHCALHQTRKTMAERPHRLQWVMSAIKQLERDIQRDLRSSPLDIKEVKTSEPMLAALESQLISFAGGGGGTPGGSSLPTLLRTASVGYLEEKIVPAVKAVHTRSYIGKLASACVSLTEQVADSPKQPKQPGFTELDGDTVVSASSLSAALCAVLSCCYAVDACCDAALPYLNAFAVIRPPGHHAGVNGPTVEGSAFAAATKQRALDAKPAVLTRAFSFVAQPTPCDGMDCSQGFCLLNNAAIAARHALLSFPARLRKVAIIDIDLHHGNGTEEIVRKRLPRRGPLLDAPLIRP
jgi:acetoin utilization deacetylase AcuC-like enzyme